MRAARDERITVSMHQPAIRRTCRSGSMPGCFRRGSGPSTRPESVVCWRRTGAGWGRGDGELYAGEEGESGGSDGGVEDGVVFEIYSILAGRWAGACSQLGRFSARQHRSCLDTFRLGRVVPRHGRAAATPGSVDCPSGRRSLLLSPAAVQSTALKSVTGAAYV